MPPKRKPLEDRFWPKVDKTETCWIWTGAKDPNGYGRVNQGGHNGRAKLAHRVACELSGRTLDPSLQLDHLCRNPSCVRPDHLEEVTSRENTMRGVHPWVLICKTGRCRRGHDRSPENVYINARGRPICRPCRRMVEREWRKRTGNAAQKAWRAANRERVKSYQSAWFAARPDYKKNRRSNANG